MIERLQAGDTFASAAAAHPEAFPNFYVGILSSAELTGNLDVVLDQLADYIERDIEARSKITAALIYPAVVARHGRGRRGHSGHLRDAEVRRLLQVVQRQAAASHPDAARHFELRQHLVVGDPRSCPRRSSSASLVLRRSRRGKAWLDSMILKMPILGDLVRTAIIERICRILSSMIRAGVALPDAMRVTAESSNNAVYREGLDTVREEMMEGQGLAEPLARTGLFPGAARQMFRVGEETGTLDAQLATAAAFYDRELDVKLKRFTGLFEPAVIIFMGVDRRLRRRRARFRHVRHLPPGEGAVGSVGPARNQYASCGIAAIFLFLRVNAFFRNRNTDKCNDQFHCELSARP